ncbi:MAG: hypothetical protein IE933_14395 [Sphingomonadales bacterium]|nr:hypothetical protein [Sphingomonadales bacterium]MBD3775401.1 hypothetical protein [Paracoccaceae bacterium]
MKRQMPAAGLRLEVPFEFEKRGSTDIVVRLEDASVGIELKYLTRRLACEFEGEMFRLKAHGATDLRRYDILKDVQRLERFNLAHGGPSYVIALTNDPAYWREVARTGTIDAAFRLCDGRTVTGECRWAEHAAPGSIRNREDCITLRGHYSMRWQAYSDLGMASGQFRYLLIPVG